MLYIFKILLIVLFLYSPFACKNIDKSDDNNLKLVKDTIYQGDNENVDDFCPPLAFYIEKPQPKLNLPQNINHDCMKGKFLVRLYIDSIGNVLRTDVVVVNLSNSTRSINYYFISEYDNEPKYPNDVMVFYNCIVDYVKGLKFTREKSVKPLNINVLNVLIWTQ